MNQRLLGHQKRPRYGSLQALLLSRSRFFPPNCAYFSSIETLQTVMADLLFLVPESRVLQLRMQLTDRNNRNPLPLTDVRI